MDKKCLYLFLSEMKPAPKSTGNKWQAEHLFYTDKWCQSTVYFVDPEATRKLFEKHGIRVK